MTPRRPGRPRETSHDEIRDVARRLFAEQGYAATSLRQIAAAVGISRTALFHYFPAKRDLMWEEYDAGVVRMRAVLDESIGRPLVDRLAEALIVLNDYRPDEHDAVAVRWRLAREDDELRAYTALRVEELVRILVDVATRVVPEIDPQLVDHVARALVAVAARCTDEWMELAAPCEGLGAYTKSRLAPFVEALRPMLA